MYTICNLCGCKEVKTLCDFNDYKILKCLNCGLIYAFPFLAKDLVINIFESFYGKGGEFVSFCLDLADILVDRHNDSYSRYSRDFHLINRYKTSGKICDLGCGIGSFFSVFPKDKWKFYGIDISPLAVNKAREVFNGNIFCGEFEEYPFEDNHFDVIAMRDYLEHVRDPMKVISRAFRVLSHGGVLFISIPRVPNILTMVCSAVYNMSLGKIRKYSRVLFPLTHFYYFSDTTIKKYLTNNGFSIVELIKEWTDIRYLNIAQHKKAIVEMLFVLGNILRLQNRMIVIARKGR